MTLIQITEPAMTDWRDLDATVTGCYATGSRLPDPAARGIAAGIPTPFGRNIAELAAGRMTDGDALLDQLGPLVAQMPNATSLLMLHRWVQWAIDHAPVGATRQGFRETPVSELERGDVLIDGSRVVAVTCDLGLATGSGTPLYVVCFENDPADAMGDPAWIRSYLPTDTFAVKA